MRIIEQYEEHPQQEYLAIKRATYIGDFAIRLHFSNGHQKLVDFKPFLEQAKHPDIQKYLNEEAFKHFQIKDGNLDWNDFDMCFPIEDLYHNTILKKDKKIGIV